MDEVKVKKLLFIPGIGDTHWTLLKLQSWLKKRGWDNDPPEIWIWDIDNRPRTLEYLQYVPWVRAGGYWRQPLEGEAKKGFDRLYFEVNSGDCIENFFGFDAFLGVNGNMRNGVDFQSLMDGAEINYKYGPVRVPHGYGVAQKKRGPYFVLQVSSFGPFKTHWCSVLTPEVIRKLVDKLRGEFPGHRFLFTGCAWDDEYSRLCVSNQDEMLVGQTTLPDLLSLLHHARGYLGWCVAPAILAQHFGTPTVVWWSRNYFPWHDRVGWETPHVVRKHFVLDVEDYRHEGLLPERIVSFLKGKGRR